MRKNILKDKTAFDKLVRNLSVQGIDVSPSEPKHYPCAVSYKITDNPDNSVSASFSYTYLKDVI